MRTSPIYYNNNNELLTTDNEQYQYDANGNMTQKTVGSVVTKFFYNLEDRLERVEDGSGNVVATYYYDPFGRRLWKEVSGARTYFHYADEGLVAELDASGNVTKSYGYKPGSTWTTDPLFMKQGAEYYFYHNDHLGTPQKMTAVNGAVVWSAKYSSFGKAEIDLAPTITNNVRFPGQYYDSETGLHYNYHRYYDPKTGRYLTPDPIGFLGGDINLFVFVMNNPINEVDPLGLARYRVYWHAASVGAAGIGGSEIDGVIVSMEKSCDGPCKGRYEGVHFGGVFLGVAAGLPIGGTFNNEEIFEDKYDKPDIRRIQGWSWYLSAGYAFGDSGKSAGTYNFGELRGTKIDVSDTEGYDLGVEYLSGKIKMEGEVFCVQYPFLK